METFCSFNKMIERNTGEIETNKETKTYFMFYFFKLFISGCIKTLTKNKGNICYLRTIEKIVELFNIRE